jgi:hypothetical protein
MKFARIDLSKTNYSLINSAQILKNPPVAKLQEIYKTYCRYKKFSSVLPIFDSQFTDPKNDVIAYYDNNDIVAFSLAKIHDHKNAEAWQFAWNYHNPKMYLGIRSLEHECAWYKQLGYQYLYIGEAQKYKSQFNGYEVLGTL